jgi:hypothetical protein
MWLNAAALLYCFVQVCAVGDVELHTLIESPNMTHDIAAAHLIRMKGRYPEELLLPHGLNARPLTGMCYSQHQLMK